MASSGPAVSHESSEIPSTTKEKRVRRAYKASTLITEYSSLNVVKYIRNAYCTAVVDESEE